MDFIKFRDAVNANIDRMIEHGEVFYVETLTDLREVYLEAFPQGSNPIHKERGYYDCTCCKSFIKNMGGLVTIEDGERQTIWDVELGDDFQVVADTLREVIMQQPITGLFRSKEGKISSKVSNQRLDNDEILSWDHFYYNLPANLVESGAEWRSESQGHFDVLKRSIHEISLDACETVLDLIDNKSIYRGDEHKSAICDLRHLVKKNDTTPLTDDHLWNMSQRLGFAGRYKNTVIGTLLHDISTGDSLTDAVKKFESKVAPENYKRPKALVTQKMIDGAAKKIEELGIQDALPRRYAVESDITVNNVLFADRSTKIQGVLGDLKPTKASKSKKDAEEILIDAFLTDVLPGSSKIEAFFDNKHSGNLVSLIAPVNADAENILKWDNNFSWTYNGDVTDTIKERVKAAGGKVDGVLRASLSWYNSDDLDIHMKVPGSSEISYSNKSSGGGNLDVDMNVSGGNGNGNNSTNPVENITFAKAPKDGKYEVIINQYTKRNTNNVGFEVELEFFGEMYNFSYAKTQRNGSNVSVIKFTIKGNVLTIDKSLPHTKTSSNKWGVDTEQWVQIVTIMKSPNYWDDQTVGNQHTFFMLKDCVNPESSRGLYNEFLKDELNEHRKVFELLGSKMKTEESDSQLSGVGFSSTKSSTLKCRVDGRVFEILF